MSTCVKHPTAEYAPRYRTETTESDEEFVLIAHVRGWCHDMNACLLCKAQQRAFAAERQLDQIISG